MPKGFLKHFSFLGLVLAALVASATLVLHDRRYLYGVAAGAGWAWFNFFFLSRLIEMGMSGVPAKKNKLAILSVLKFPVLYVAGFFLLRSRSLAVTGLLAGFTALFAAFLISWASAARTGRVAGQAS